jgi:hypothetical protein
MEWDAGGRERDGNININIYDTREIKEGIREI